MRKLQFLFEAGAFYDQIFALLFESAIVLSVLYHLQKRLMNPHIRVEFRVEGEGHLVFVFYTDDPLFHNREHLHAIHNRCNIRRTDKRHRHSSDARNLCFSLEDA